MNYKTLTEYVCIKDFCNEFCEDNNLSIKKGDKVIIHGSSSPKKTKYINKYINVGNYNIFLDSEDEEYFITMVEYRNKILKELGIQFV